MSLLKSAPTKSDAAEAVDAAGEAAEVAREKASESLAAAQVAAKEKLEQAQEKLGPAMDSAKEWAAPKVESAKEWAGPKLEEAKERAAPVIAGVVAAAMPRIEQALEQAGDRLQAALEASAPAREEATARAEAAVAALKGEVAVAEKESHWGRRILLFGLVVGIAAAVYAFLKRRSEDDSWITAESTYASTNGWSSSEPPSASADDHEHDIEGVKAAESDAESTDDAADSDDAGGASPDEALADAAEEPKAPTTPDDPAERTEPKG